MLFVPEILIYNYLNAILTELKTSITSSSSNNLITKLFTGVSAMGDFNMKNEALAFFVKDKCLDIKVGLDISTKTLPALHLYLPEESSSSIPIGVDPSFVDEDFDDNSFEEQNTIRFSTRYNIAIITLNGDQAVMIYQVLKWMIMRYISILEAEGFMNVKITGADLKMEQNIIPQTVFTRILSLGFEYEVQSINKMTYEGGKSLEVDRIKLDMKLILED